MEDDLSKDLSRMGKTGLVLTAVGALLLGIAVSALLVLWTIQELDGGRVLAILSVLAVAVLSTTDGMTISLKAQEERTARGPDEPVDHEAQKARAEQGARSMKTVMLLIPVSLALWMLLAYVIEYWDWRTAPVLGLVHILAFVQAFFSYRRHTNELVP